MGKISDTMQNTVDEIRSSTEARETFLRELLEETKQLIKTTDNTMRDIHNARQAQTKVIKEKLSSDREKLSSDEKARVETMQEFMGEIGKSIKDIKIRVSEIRSGASSLMEKFRLEHRDAAEALREKLSSDEKARVKAVREMLDEVASDLRQARKIWSEIGKKKIIPEVVAKKVVEEIEGKPEVEAAPLPSGREKILEVISRHPEGIKLVDIGNELGVDWRTLIGSVKSLVNEDKIEKIDTMYHSKTEE